MAELPKKVFLREDGPREGFQMHPEFVPTEQKLELIHALTKTGIQSIEVTSFVRHDRVPQLRDAAILASKLEKVSGVRYRALYLNQVGLEEALQFPLLQLEGYILLAASESFLRKNNNMSLADALAGLESWLKLFQKYKLQFERIMFSTVFGDMDEGKIAVAKSLGVIQSALERAGSLGALPKEVTFADTTGFANPRAIERLVGEFRSRFPEIEVGLHLHDTRGSGMANVYAGLLAGVSRFDCSVGGLGGCPFTKSTAGNVPTEDVAFLCAELGIETGVDLRAYIECAKLAEHIVGRPLPGKLKNAGVLP